MQALILRLDIAGSPVTWIPWQNAACLYSRDMVAWTAGDSIFTFKGGINRVTGLRSKVNINSIIAIKRSAIRIRAKRHIPPHTYRELFFRDAHICMFCGDLFQESLIKNILGNLYCSGA